MEDTLIAPTNDANCPDCSTTNNRTSKYCVKCGYPIQGDEEEKKKFKSAKTVKTINLEEYNGKIKSAKTTLFVISGFTAVFGTILALVGDDGNEVLLIVINLFLAGIYLALGFWCAKKPFAAILSGLIIYVSLIIVNGVAEPKTIAQGIIMKGIIIAYLIKGLKSAKEAEAIKKELNIES